MEREMRPIIFTPSDEPYLGRNLLFHFDQLICSMMEQNAVTVPASRNRQLTDLQHMACQVIAQGLSIALSIRELIRQGYLFSGHILLRALVERAAILLYIHLYPDKIKIWKQGWNNRDAPSLAKMLDAIKEKQQFDSDICGKDFTAAMNSLLHAKPDSAAWNLVPLGDEKAGHAVSKILNRPDLCDDLCVGVIPWLLVIQGMMVAYFDNPDL